VKKRTTEDFDRSRRSFIKGISLGAAGLALNSTGVSRNVNAAQALPDKSRVSFVTGSDRREMVYQALKPFEKEIREGINGRQIIIKPNFVHNDLPLCATQPDAVRGLLDFLKPLYNKKIIIAESTVSRTGTKEGFKNYGYLPLVKEYNVSLVDLNEQSSSPVWILDKNLHPQQIQIIDTFLNPDNYFISITRLKTHDTVVATLGLKNMVMGSPLHIYNVENYKSFMHSGGPRWLNYNMFLVAQKVRPHLTVLDGLEGMEGNGPVRGTPVEHGVALAGTDVLAVDRIGVELMGINYGDIGYLNYCADAGMGQIERSNITIIGKNPGDYVKKYKMHDNIERQLKWKGDFVQQKS